MLTEKRKKELVKMLVELQPGIVNILGQYEPEEQRYIHYLVVHQKRDLGWEIEFNGTAENPASHTRFKKMILHTEP